MLYALMGYAHAAITRRVQQIRRLAGEAGQGTVEYVGLILLVSLLMVGMVAAMKGNRARRRDRRQDQGGGRQGRLQIGVGARRRLVRLVRCARSASIT